MDRRAKILKHINANGKGIEIGPGHAPIAPKSEGFNVQVIDVCNHQELISKFSSLGVDLTRIEEVDFIWSGQSYAELTSKEKYYDWIISSHSIEHTTDLVTFLNDCDHILKENGVLSLAIPDKRRCFDYFRSITGIDKVIDFYLSRKVIHSPGTLIDLNLNCCSRESGQQSWELDSKEEFHVAQSLDQISSQLSDVISDPYYMKTVDIHNWVFVPHSFRLLIHDLYQLGLIGLREVDFYPTWGNEFYVTLSRQGKGVDLSRLDMLKAIEYELAQPILFQQELQRQEVEQLRKEIDAMKQSKFWKLRNVWYEIKGLFK